MSLRNEEHISTAYYETAWSPCSVMCRGTHSCSLIIKCLVTTRKQRHTNNLNMVFIGFRFSDTAEVLSLSGFLVKIFPKTRIFQTVPVVPREFLSSRYGVFWWKPPCLTFLDIGRCYQCHRCTWVRMVVWKVRYHSEGLGAPCFEGVFSPSVLVLRSCHSCSTTWKQTDWARVWTGASWLSSPVRRAVVWAVATQRNSCGSRM